MSDKRNYATLRFDRTIREDLDLSALVYYDRYDFETALPLFGNVFRYQFEQTGEWWGSEIRVSKSFFERHRVTLGAEYRDDFHQFSRLAIEGAQAAPIPPITADRDRESYGIYVEGESRLRTNLVLVAGARLDDYSQSDPSISPRVALIYNPFEKSTFKVLYGTAFRTPNFREQSNLSFGTINFENKTTDEIDSYELAYEQGLGKHLRSTVNLYYNES